ncbi:MAG: ATP synthase subunit I [Proteobacteria bacterium]|nr:ATP synthase subunit I [Pseudomonadota bacterium]MBU1060116.1 ATP synthase subunit I [Pseudomonadota bacterium]
MKQVQVLSFGFLLVLTGGSWLIMSWFFAQSVLVGGVIAIASFFSGHRDIASFLKTFEPPPEEKEKEKKSFGKSRYIVKFWLRLALIAVVLLLFIKSGQANVIGLLLGLSTVVFAIILTTLNVAGRYFLSRRR